MDKKLCKLFACGFVVHCIFAFAVPGGKDSDPDGVFEPRKERDFYLQAEKIEWDYLPRQQNMVSFYDE